jgi:hypothetical protein
MELLANVVRTRARTKCGATKPTNAIKPVWATAVAVAKAMTANKMKRKGATRKPKLCAVASPKLKPSSKGLSRQANNPHINKAQAIRVHEAPLSMAVDPSVNDCMAG